MNDKQLKLLNALKLIKNTCHEQRGCDNCPLSKRAGNGWNCIVSKEMPYEWDIKEPEDIKWDAFHD